MTAEGRGSDQSVNDGVIVITFPGYNPKDYSVEVNYAGAFVDKSENSYAVANVQLGADVEEAQLAVVEGDNVDAALNDMLNGALETISVKESGEVKVPCNYSGMCTLVAVSYAGGEAQDYGYATFNYTLSPSDWKTIGTGLYTDWIYRLNLIDENEQPVPEVTYPVEIQESAKEPGLYRVINPYAEGTYGYKVQNYAYDSSQDHHIIINATDPDAVYIQSQPLGFPDKNNDDMLILTMGGLALDLGWPLDEAKEKGMIKGTLKNGVISFPPKELLFSYQSIIAEGKAGRVDEVNATDLLVLPEAVNASSKAKAVKVHKAAKLKTGNKTSKRKKCNVNMKKSKFQITKKFSLNRVKFVK